MSITKQIYDLLATEPLTSNQIAEKLHIDTNKTIVYLNRLKKKGAIKPIKKVGREYIYVAISPENGKMLEDLKFLYNIMNNKMDPNQRLNEEDLKRLKQIEEVLGNE